MSKLGELFEKLENNFNSAKSEFVSFESGKKLSAGKLRKEAMEAKKLWQEVRFATMEALKEMPVKTRSK